MKADIKVSLPPTIASRKHSQPFSARALKRASVLLGVVVFLLLCPGPVAGQGGRTLFGEVKINSGNADLSKVSLILILYKEGSVEVGRQPLTNRSQYRFTNLADGDYEIVIEAEANEIARVRISMLPGTLSNSPYGFRQDLEFKWNPNNAPRPKAGTVSTADLYERSSANKSLFEKAQKAVEKKDFDSTIASLRKILETDKDDFQVWTLLGTVYLIQEKAAEAEEAYLTAIQVRPTYSKALINLGRLRASQKRYKEAIETLTSAVASQPQSAEANFLLGEAYIQVKEGSRAIGYLNDAARLGRKEAHLRLAWLYHAAGMKDKAALEYEEFLKKNPEYPERQKLKEYISANKKA